MIFSNEQIKPGEILNKSNLLDYSIMILFAVSALIFIWSNRILPFQDYPDWLFQGYIFSTYLGDNILQGYQIGGYMIPNSFSTLFIGSISFLLDIEMAGKLCVTITVLTLAFGSVYCVTSFNEGKINSIVLIPLLLVLNNSLFKGNINYIFSLGLLLLLVGIVIRKQSNRYNASKTLLIGLILLLYFSHGISFIIWLIFLLFIYISSYHNKRFFVDLLFSTVPSLVLLVLYFINSIILTKSPSTFDFNFLEHISFKIRSILEYLSIISKHFPQYLYEDTTVITYIGATVNLLFLSIVALVVIIGIKKPDKQKKNYLYFAIAILLFFVISPISLFGVHNPGQRFILPGLFIGMAVVLPSYQNKLNKGLGKVIRIFLIIIMFFQIFYLQVPVRAISENLEANLSAIKEKLQENNTENNYLAVYAPDYKITGKIISNYPFNYSFIEKFVPNIRSLARIPYYLNIKFRTAAPIFPTGLVQEISPIKPLTTIRRAVTIKNPDAVIAIMNSKEENSSVKDILGVDYSTQYSNSYLSIFIK